MTATHRKHTLVTGAVLLMLSMPVAADNSGEQPGTPARPAAAPQAVALDDSSALKLPGAADTQHGGDLLFAPSSLDGLADASARYDLKMPAQLVTFGF